jgi:hypothetical protein
MKTTATQNERGFIALISVIIISVVLLATTIALAQFGIASRYFILHLEQKAVSEKLADACVHIARIMVYNDPKTDFDAAVSYPIGDEECSIVSITPDGDESIVEARGVVGDAVTNYSVVIYNSLATDDDDGEFVSWTEVASF